MSKLLIFIIVLLIIFLYLFREPPIYVNPAKNIIISPAYGKIYKIKKINNHICISIILTIFDVHFQYVPCDGVVRNISYDRNGIFNIVFKNYDKTRYNEKMIYEIDSNYGKVYVYQIAGYFFRRIIKFIHKNTFVKKGDKLGMITFGSRVDICLPVKNLRLTIKENDDIKGGEKIGYYHN